MQERDGQFESVNENAITFARTLVNWPAQFEGPATILVGGLEPSRYSEESTVSNIYWNNCPRNLADCYTYRAGEKVDLPQRIVARTSDASYEVDATARSAFLAQCGIFMGPADDPLLRACAGVDRFDPNLADIDGVMGEAALHFGMDATRGVAVSTVEAGGYCGSGGCSYTTSLWLRGADGRFAFADTFDNDEFAIVLDPVGQVAEVVTSGNGQSGIASQFAYVTRYLQRDAHFEAMSSFTFREEYSGSALDDRTVPPSLTVCPEIRGARPNPEEICE